MVRWRGNVAEEVLRVWSAEQAASAWVVFAHGCGVLVWSLQRAAVELGGRELGIVRGVDAGWCCYARDWWEWVRYLWVEKCGW